MWEERYSAEEYAYGTAPNDFLAAHVNNLPAGRILCIAEGEGRNAVWLAEQGREVTAVEGSAAGVRKMQKLADSRGVTITPVQADLADFDIGQNRWDGIVSSFGHLPPTLRADVHRRCIEGLRPGGIMLLEAYNPNQLTFRTGGPASADMMMSEQTLRSEFAGMEFLLLQECEREVVEGRYHTGRAAVVQMIARKPLAG